MGRHRVGWIISILFAIAALSVSARASETPVYFVTGGTAFYTGLTDGEFSFSGPTFDITFFSEGQGGNTTSVGVNAGSVFGSVSASGDNFGFGTVNGIFYPRLDFFGSGLFVGGTANLPDTPITLAATGPSSFVSLSGPAFFSGSVTACAPFDNCIQGGTTANIFILDLNNTGIATFHINRDFGPDYNVFDESFTVTPEPGTWLLYGTGVLMIGFILLRKRSVLAR